MSELFTAENMVAFVTLLALEIILGIDNVIFIAILTGKLPENQRDRARKLGISLAVISRIVLLLGISWIIQLTQPVVTIFSNPLSGRDLILLGGGLFLIAKSTFEIHEKLEAEEHIEDSATKKATSFMAVIFQILLIDVVFSLDSVITAVGLSGNLIIMITAIILAAVVMVVASGAISTFVENHPTMKILALSFLILIGAMLVIEGWSAEATHDLHLRNYVYFAMFFSFTVELVNMRFRKESNVPVKFLNQPHLPEGQED